MIMNRGLKQVGTSMFLVFLSGSLWAQEKAPKLTVDLDKAIEIALSENPTIKVADMEITRKIMQKRNGR